MQHIEQEPKYYSQCGEDKYLNDTFFKGKKNGTFIELGALDGIIYSNTKYFEDTHGWRGILIEPHPVAYPCLVENRGSVPGNYVFNNLVSSNTEPLPFRYLNTGPYGAAVSGVDSTLMAQVRRDYFHSGNDYINCVQMMRPRSLADIVAETGLTHIDFLSLDVEGHELEVLTSFHFSVPVDLILIEALDKDKAVLCNKYLTDHGYVLCGHVKDVDEVYLHNSCQLYQDYLAEQKNENTMYKTILHE